MNADELILELINKRFKGVLTGIRERTIMNYFKQVFINARRGGKTAEQKIQEYGMFSGYYPRDEKLQAWHQNQLIDVSDNRRNNMSETLPTKKENVLKTIEKYPESKKYFTKLFPEWFSEGFVSGDLFFEIARYCQDHNLSLNERKDFERNLISHSINICNLDATEYTYLLGHLKNSHEYGLFNLSTGYQFHRDAIYIRKLSVGIMIPRETLTGLIKIRDGGGK